MNWWAPSGASDVQDTCDSPSADRAVARVCVRGQDAVELSHGDLIGRLPSAALVIDDPRVSEAHAMVSLRRGALHLLALRRMIAVDGAPVSEVRLRPGLHVQLAEDLTLAVEFVSTPSRVVALRAPGVGTRALGHVASVFDGDPPYMVGRFRAGADAYVWSSGAQWRLRTGDGQDRSLAIGDEFFVGAQSFELCSVAIETAGEGSTQLEGAVASPLRLVANYDSVEIHRERRPVTLVAGQGARILSELVAFDGPVHWKTLAAEVWSGDIDDHDLRHRWDVALSRLRAKLRREHLRADLIHTDGGGRVQLVLYPGDHVQDRS